ncbi:HBL/NHE enterotoxin family protein [Bacillus thuringiensis]|uniref:Hemolytic enterotoxin n=1 Tax=Bacillus thuringiensis TaxID=1428 RepID=A0A9W3XI99_BACTU|nr:HBL/NHE enterotoxin family protein [Bacillus thuringiensis]AQY38412.1 hemolytic enterotoxin [Bacillus thuringiensis]MDR4151190.1 HBL/NHE enterotoxin family protein [Bacillus thuringiensis]MEC3570244.1 HBL/NHE enterotoxin family protein [Bacillus thuringiensis]MED2022384.1 HBL/NHE enterotoxin family protein [Bacillus thuringiensis]MED2145443.1 HBL/NHE enterotoxin family protein [Bacillus thuringiensis]
MKKQSIKVMASSVVLTSLMTTSILPSYTFAAEKNTQVTTLNEISKNDLEQIMGPGNLEKAIKQAKGNVLTLDIYANTLQKQPTASFSAASSVNEQLNKSVVEQQNIARKNSAEWLDVLKPNMIQINEDILNYARNIESFSGTMKKSITDKNVDKFTKGIELLLKKSTTHKQRVDELIASLNQYRTKISTDTQNLKESTLAINTSVAGNNAEIAALKSQLDAYNTAMNNATTAIVLGSSGLVIGVVFMVTGVIMLGSGVGLAIGLPVLGTGGLVTAGGITGTVIGSQQMDNIRINIKDNTMKMTSLTQEVAGLNVVNSQIQNFTKNIDQAINALQNLSNGWGDVSAKYKSLLENIKDSKDLGIDGEEFTSDSIDVITKTWQDLATQAGNIYVDTNEDKLKP